MTTTRTKHQSGVSLAIDRLEALDADINWSIDSCSTLPDHVLRDIENCMAFAIHGKTYYNGLISIIHTMLGRIEQCDKPDQLDRLQKQVKAWIDKYEIK